MLICCLHLESLAFLKDTVRRLMRKRVEISEVISLKPGVGKG